MPLIVDNQTSLDSGSCPRFDRLSLPQWRSGLTKWRERAFYQTIATSDWWERSYRSNLQNNQFEAYLGKKSILYRKKSLECFFLKMIESIDLFILFVFVDIALVLLQERYIANCRNTSFNNFACAITETQRDFLWGRCSLDTKRSPRVFSRDICPRPPGAYKLSTCIEGSSYGRLAKASLPARCKTIHYRVIYDSQSASRSLCYTLTIPFS